MDLSLIVITRDAADTLEACLRSVPFASQKVVVDSGSSDETTAIARSCGAEVFERDFTGFGRQKQWALERASCEMVLSLDADEALDPGLADAIRNLLQGIPEEIPGDVSGYRIRRRTCYMGRLLRFGPWLRDRPLRLFRRKDAEFTGATVHEEVVLRRGRAVRMRGGHIVHRPYRDFCDHLDTISRYGRLWAEREHASGRRAGLYSVLLRPFWRFVLGYFLRLGFLDGYPGFVASEASALYAFCKWSMLRGMGRSDDGSFPCRPHGVATDRPGRRGPEDPPAGCAPGPTGPPGRREHPG